MGFRINTNVSAMNAHRNATQTNLGLSKSLTALSSGLRINKSADDASGMAIANTLRQQSEGLGQAINNANDAIGLAQTADGALDEYTKIVDTIKTKAIQAASDGQNLDTRKKIQADIDRLLEEAQNIAATTSFNGQTLLNGGYKNKSFQIGAYSGETVKLTIDNTQIDKIGKFTLVETSTGFSDVAAADNSGATASLSLTVVNADGTTVSVSTTTTYTSGVDISGYEYAQKLIDKFNEAAQLKSADVRASLVEATGSTPDNPEYGIRLESSVDLSAIAVTETVNDSKGTGFASAAGTANLDNNLSTINVTSRRDAQKAINTTVYALKDIDAIRSDIGSVQNQLESTVRNISVTQVNVTAAESQIRDVDFAAESANFSKLNILAQSGSYALSQANAVQQNVMRLLQ
ncbi:MAG TPA: flagellin [Sulfurimonas autotrophica]|nr:flagellin [Sulfurimonas autotrophica]